MKDEVSTDFSPLSAACVRALTDKIYEKRKSAALEIEKMIRDFNETQNTTQINKLIHVLGQDFCLSPNANARKGGLLGLAATMIALRSNNYRQASPGALPTLATQNFNSTTLNNIVRPILTCFMDPDSRVRYYACESLYNIIKVVRSEIKSLFNEVFDCLAKVVADQDVQVRGGAELIDRLLKDIICEDSKFDIGSFVLRLRECIYTINPFARLFILSWIRLLDSVPNSGFIDHLPHLLDGVFNCLRDSSDEIRSYALSVLSEFLNEIVTNPSNRPDIPSMLNILIVHSQDEKEILVRLTAVNWLRQFIGLMDNVTLISTCPSVLTAILPCLAYSPNTISDEDTEDLPDGISSAKDALGGSIQNSVYEAANLLNSQLLEQVTSAIQMHRELPLEESLPFNMDLDAIVEVLTKEMLKVEHSAVKLAILIWFKRLRQAEPDIIFAGPDLDPKLFSALLDSLSDKSDEVVKLVLQVLAEILCSLDADHMQDGNEVPPISPTLIKTVDEEPKKSPAGLKGISKSADRPKSLESKAKTKFTSQDQDKNFNRFMLSLVNLFRKNEVVFVERGSFIILNLCAIMKPELIYRSMANILKDERSDLKFTYSMVQKLNEILLTSQELFGQRTKLRAAATTDDPTLLSLFSCLYLAWCHSPIATLSLCLLTNHHKHSYDIVMALSNIDMTLETMTELDRLIQLIESPIFAFLRLQLLEPEANPHLIKCLYGLLMVLPQSEAFHKLRNRLKCVPSLFRPSGIPSIPKPTQANQRAGASDKSKSGQLDFNQLLRHFKSTQAEHSKYRSETR